MSKLLFALLLCNSLSYYSQSDIENDSSVIVLRRYSNVFLQGSKRLNKAQIIAMSSNHYMLKSMNKNIQDFYKYKANKNGYAIASFSSIGLGSSIVYLAIREGGSEAEAIAVSSVFGGATIGFATGWMINKIKFYKSKRKILKALS